MKSKLFIHFNLKSFTLPLKRYHIRTTPAIGALDICPAPSPAPTPSTAFGGSANVGENRVQTHPKMTNTEIVLRLNPIFG